MGGASALGYEHAIFMPLYELIMLFAYFVGFAAVLSVPTLGSSQADLSLLRISLQQFEPWVVGLIGPAGLLTALVPGSVLLMVSATVLSKNVYGVLRPETSEETVGTLAKFLVPVVALVTLVFTLGNALNLVLLALLGSAYVTHLLPALLFSLMGNNFATKWAAAAGILVGVTIVTYLTVTGLTLRAIFPFLGSMGDINVGIVALLANVVVLLAVSLATRTSTATDKAGASPDLPCKLHAEDVRDTGKGPLDTERKEPDKNADNFERRNARGLHGHPGPREAHQGRRD